MTKVFYTSIEEQLSSEVFDWHLRSLPTEVKNTILRYINWKDRQLVLFGKLLLLEALKRSGNTDLTLNSIKYTEFKKPYFNSTLDFNISHSGKYVVCAFSTDEKVGVDIEEITSVDITDFRSQWTDNEWASINGAQNKQLQFFKFWTRKEAIIKADGRGMHIPLTRIEVLNDTVHLDNATWYLKEVQLDDKGYITHLATSLNLPRRAITVEKLQFQAG